MAARHRHSGDLCTAGKDTHFIIVNLAITKVDSSTRNRSNKQHQWRILARDDERTNPSSTFTKRQAMNTFCTSRSRAADPFMHR